MHVRVPLDRIDIPQQLLHVAPATAAEARAYHKAVEIGTPTHGSRSMKVVPIIVRHAEDGRYTLVAGARRVMMARRAGVLAIDATLENTDG